MASKKTIIVALILTLVFVGFYFTTRPSTDEGFQAADKLFQEKPLNAEILSFARMFVDKILKANGAVDFEDRLKLESSARALNDEEILNQWVKFTESKTEEEAQGEVINLLSLLLGKMGWGGCGCDLFESMGY